MKENLSFRELFTIILNNFYIVLFHNSPFKKIENCLPDNFVRCHKSYMVNLDNITGYNAKDNSIIFSNNSTCFVGTKYKENLKEVLHNEFITKSLESVNN